jgi:hypothetical protein
MSNMELDGFGILKKFPDLEGGITIEQDGPEWGDTYQPHGYESVKDVTIMRKTFSFTKKLKPDQEVTIYIFLPSLNKEYFKGIKGIGHCESGSGHSIKLRGGHHSNKGDKSAHCYIFHYEYEGENCKDFQKEFPHPKYTKFTLPEENTIPNWIGKVMGFKAALLNTNDGKKVEFWSWFDPSAKIVNGKLVTNNNWLLRYNGIDDGKKFRSKKNPRTNSPFLECHGDYTEFRMDNADEKTKAFCASLREIRRPSNQPG